MKKRMVSILTAAVIGAATLATVVSAAPSGAITVVSREDGSGTRGAFIELFGIEEKVDGEKVDKTTEEASITNSTSVMMTTVSGDENSIVYISVFIQFIPRHQVALVYTYHGFYTVHFSHNQELVHKNQIRFRL